MVSRSRAKLLSLLTLAGVMPAARLVKSGLQSLIPANRRLAKAHRARFAAFEREYGAVLRGSSAGAEANRGTALLMCGIFPRVVEVEIFLIRALLHAGYDVAVLRLGGSSHFTTPYHRLAGAERAYDWHSFPPALDPDAGEALLREIGDLEAVQRYEADGVRVGCFALSTALRRMHRGSLDLERPDDRSALVGHLARSLQATEGANRLLDAIDPSLVVFYDTEYSPNAQIFDSALSRGTPVLQYDMAHKSGALMLFRYAHAYRNQHPWTLSDTSWMAVRNMPWSPEDSARVSRELYNSYETGDWFSDCGTQFRTQMLSTDKVREQLDLDPRKKTAVVFSHMLWDAPVVLGHSLFSNYEEWLVETVRAACENDRLNWLVKIHPGNRGRSWMEKLGPEPVEVAVLRERIGALPSHVRMIPPETTVSAFSLLGVTDYCLTVRGTVGLEAARLGIPVVNAGGGRYDGRGFTMDPPTRSEYLEVLSRLESVPPLTSDERELADRFAYGYFIRRPLELTSVTFGFASATNDEDPYVIESTGRINVRTPDEWARSPDVQAFARWWLSDTRPDFFRPHDSMEPAERSSDVTASAGVR